MKSALSDNVSVFLLQQGFTVKQFSRHCFDILARKDETILIIKLLEDANSVTREANDELRGVSTYLHASPIIIANKAGQELEDNIVYTRFETYTVNLPTFRSCVKKEMPFIQRTQAGFTISLDGGKLREQREQLGYSLNSLSKKIGVTSKMVLKYEKNDSAVTLNKAMKLYDLFGDEVFRHVNVFSTTESLDDRATTEFSEKYVNLGFEALDTKKSPFDIIAKKRDELILTNIGKELHPATMELSKLLEAEKLVISETKQPSDIPSLTREEFLEFEKANHLIKFLKEF